MKGLLYESGDMVVGSFSYKSHQNLAVGSSAATSTAIDSTETLLSLTVAAHVAIGATATTASMALPAGVWPIRIEKGQTISVLKLTGSLDGQASVIIPR